MKPPSTEGLNLHACAAEIGYQSERLDLWYSIRKDAKMENQKAFFLTFGGHSLYSLMKNLAFTRSPASVPSNKLKIFLCHVVPLNFKAAKHAKFHFLTRGPRMRLREFILTPQTPTSKCNCRSTEGSVAWLIDWQYKPFRHSEEVTDLTLAQARAICELSDDVSDSTAKNSLVHF